ncbi:MAG: hypothetical protein H6843_00310 [Rhodospirillaceae bacterium]|nr:hypothetical protein [Rhodospirillaceae bacterium]
MADDLDKMAPQATGGRQSLADTEITTRRVERRGVLRVLSLLGGGLAAAVLRPGQGRAQTMTGITDCDRGPNQDPANLGTGNNPPNGLTDTDGGPNADYAYCGRSGNAGVTDCDNGPSQDPAGQGTGNSPPTGITDTDQGTYADFGMCGRGNG